jgi:hypothetical protein
VLFGVASLPLASAEPKITAVLNTIQLQDGQTAGPIHLLFKVEGLAREQVSLVPSVEWFAAAKNGSALELRAPVQVAKLKDGAFWQIPATVSGLPLNSTFNATVVVRLGEILSDVLSYSITNPLPTVEADVSPGSDTIFLEKSRETDFTVNAKGRPLRGLAVCQSSLADANTGDRLEDQYLGMYLAGVDSAENSQVGSQYLTLTAASTRVHLLVLPAFQDRGVFAGTVAICSASKADVATLKLTVNSSSVGAKITGAFLMAAGICLYVLVTVVLKQRNQQLTALLPASRLVEALTGLRNSAKLVADRAEVGLPVLLGEKNVIHSLEWLIAQLSLANLKKEGYLPPLLTNPFQPADAGTGYQTFLQSISSQQLNDAIIVREGLERVMLLWPQLDEGSARQALLQLDLLARHADSSTDPVRPKVDALVNGILPREQRFSAMLADAHSNFRNGGGTPPSVHEITVELEYVSAIGWTIWALLTFLIGGGVLILSNHGFGTWQDLLKCFLWGLGIQAVGQGLQALTPSSTTTSFSLQIGH